MERFGRLLDGLKKSGVERVNSWYLQTKVIHEIEEWFQDAKTVSAGWSAFQVVSMERWRSKVPVAHFITQGVSPRRDVDYLGSIGKHNVVITCLPSYGTASATIEAGHMVVSFPSMRFVLMVGIGGGIPSKSDDIRLGDVVVSKPEGTLSGVVRYDFGKSLAGGQFE
jgi:hypothetical protein